MMKATLETTLIDACNNRGQASTPIVVNKMLAKVKRIFSGSSDLATLDQHVANTVQPTRTRKNRLMNFLVNEYRKACLVGPSAKDDFFFRCDERRKNIPKRIWDRHSAFLLYSQHAHQQKSTKEQLKEQLEKTSANGLSQSDYRVSFQVCSIKVLPVWSTAIHEMSCIDCDISSLRLMETSGKKPETAQAA